MSKISLRLGVTFAVDPADRGSPWFRADVHLDEIDVEGDVDAQLARSLEALEKVSEKGEGALAQEASNISGMNVEGFGISRAFGEYKDKLKTWQNSVVGEIRRQGKLVDKVAVAAGVEADPDEEEVAEEKPAKEKKSKKAKR